MHMLETFRSSMRAFFGVSLLLAMCASLGMAQGGGTGSISGTVTDPNGLSVPGAQVIVRNIATGAERQMTTTDAGVFTVPFLVPGRYMVSVTKAGFAEFRRENVIVEIGRNSVADAQLGLAAQVETVIATATVPLITTDRPDITTNINENSIQNLPISGRRWSNLVLTTPGAVPDGGFGLISFRGISGLLNNNMVDGGSNNQAFFAEEKGRTRIAYSTSQAFIQEYEVNTSNFSAEFGRSAGGVVNAVTKSGTNQFHGDGFWYYRSSDFGAFNPFATVVPPPPAPSTPVPVKPPDKRHQFGGTLSGPVIPERVFFFFGADQQLRNFPAVANASNPAAFFAPLSAGELATLTGRGITEAQANAGLAFLQSVTGIVPRSGDQLLLFPKLDVKVSDKHHLTMSYNRMRWSSPAGIQTGAVVFRGRESFGSDFVKTDTVIARLTSSLSPTVVNEFRFNYGRDFEFQTSQPPLPGQPVSQQGVSPQIGISGSTGITFGKPNFLDRRAFPDERNYQFSNTLSWIRGNHQLKFGVDINRVRDLQDNLFQESGVYGYSNRVQFISDYVAAVNSLTPRCDGLGCYNTFDQGFGPTAFRFRTVDYALFVQDTWRLTPQLTASLGLRWDYQQMPDPQFPNPALPQTSSFPSDKNNFGPRVGAAYDLTGRGRAVLRGGYGIYYGRIINSTIFNAITLTGAPGGQSSFRRLPAQEGAPQYPLVLASGPGGAGGGNVIVFPSDTSLPRIHQFDVAFEYEFARNTSISVIYLGSLGRNLPRFVDTNLPTPTGSTTFTFVGGPDSGSTITVPLFSGPRPNPSFLAITEVSNSVESKYNAMVIQFNRRMTGGLQIQGSYTRSRATDDGQGSQTFTSINNVLNPLDLSLEQGRSNFDIPHRFSASAIWQPPYFSNRSGALLYLLDGWSVAPIVTLSSGGSYSAGVSGNAPGGTSSGILGAGGANRLPTLERNAFRMPRIAVVDMRIAKRFPIYEALRIELFGEAFNLFNRVNVTSVGTRLYSISGTNLNIDPLFGTPTASSNFFITQRQIQIGAKFSF
jgi:outer membrane receptor protein involved in Fe transport